MTDASATPAFEALRDWAIDRAMDWALNDAACYRLRIRDLEPTEAPNAKISGSGAVHSSARERHEG